MHMEWHSVVSMGALGAVFGGLLAFASNRFSVSLDPRVAEINNVLPGANCGACGFPGCNAYTEALVAGDASISACPVGGSQLLGVLSSIMGVATGTLAHRKVARVFCRKECTKRAVYQGIETCRAADAVAGGPESCQWACIGLGDCLRVCSFNAIVINSKGCASVDEAKCQSCGLCPLACPKKVISMVPDSWAIHVDCSSQDRGAAVRQTGCFTGCISCGVCERVCPFKAIHVMGDVEPPEQVQRTRPVRHLAVIDYELCRECSLCSNRCPTRAIHVQLDKTHGAAVILAACNGCTLCAKACPVQAIAGDSGQLHQVNHDLCIGCGLCMDICPEQAITRLMYC